MLWHIDMFQTRPRDCAASRRNCVRKFFLKGGRCDIINQPMRRNRPRETRGAVEAGSGSRGPGSIRQGPDGLGQIIQKGAFKLGFLTDAMIFAISAHGEAVRKGDGSPAILHAMEAAAVAASLTHDQEVLAAAVLHDTVEDTQAELEEIRTRFGERVAALVGAETEDKMRHLPPDQSWRVRKEAAIAGLRAAEDPGVAVVTLGDKLSNLRALSRSKREKGGAMWEAFHQKDPEQHHWYYRTISEVLSPLAGTAAWQEYDWLIRQVFEETGPEHNTAPQETGE